MPKRTKKTQNKALHTKLLNRKKTKLQEGKAAKALRLKALVTKMNQKRSDKSEFKSVAYLNLC
jgi:hypothetical protein